MNSLITGEVSTIKLMSFETFRVYILGVGSTWILTRWVTSDHTIDGYRIFPSKYVKDNYLERFDNLSTRIINLKGINITGGIMFDLNDISDLFDYIFENRLLFQFYLKSPNVAYVGSIIKINKSSCRIRMLSAYGEWLKDFNFKFKSFRMIELDNEYLNSLSLICHQ